MWGEPPGPRGSPWIRSSLINQGNHHLREPPIPDTTTTVTFALWTLPLAVPVTTTL
jgi:hypothetical protein